RGTGRPIRIREVGAGTGSATSAVLNALQGCRVEYTVTDVSPLFMHRARERFAAYQYVRFATLDITRDPLAQGFAAGSFDLVIGANVFHATADILHALRAAVSLLAPSGHLLLLEGTA